MCVFVAAADAIVVPGDLVVCTTRFFFPPFLFPLTPQAAFASCVRQGKAGRELVGMLFFAPCFVRGFGTPYDVSERRCSAGRSIEGMRGESDVFRGDCQMAPRAVLGHRFRGCP